jgi:hypothetical protein
MVLDGDVVHMAYRYSEWRKPDFDYETQSCYSVDEVRYASLTPEGNLISDDGRVLLRPSEPWDSTDCSGGILKQEAPERRGRHLLVVAGCPNTTKWWPLERTESRKTRG